MLQNLAFSHLKPKRCFKKKISKRKARLLSTIRSARTSFLRLLIVSSIHFVKKGEVLSSQKWEQEIRDGDAFHIFHALYVNKQVKAVTCCLM